MDAIKTFIVDSKSSTNPELSSQVSTRISQLRQWAQSLREAQPSDDEQWQQVIKMIDYQCLCAKSFLQGIYQLPGVTGESNELWLEPRGLTGIIIDENMPAAAISAALSAALICHNPVKLAVHPQLKIYVKGMLNQLLGRFCAKDAAMLIDWRQWPELLQDPSLKVVCMAATKDNLIRANRLLAIREGSLVMFLSETDPYLPSFSSETFCIGLCTEKVCTINTTAIGGNASLLELAATAIPMN
ncbi:hypothetical protein [Celerinatantimonas yamalensis]|uniref:Delta-1-pyrroline-5-carboxylate dehydrogenase n=1 Tax=Celerinatantimonas yamalensis TaxID=559956 RepID=A0ABW9G4C5_9GAMM